MHRLIILAVVGMCLLAGPVTEANDSQAVLNIAESYAGHRAGFSSLRVDFEWTEGIAVSEADADAGIIAWKQAELTGVLIYANRWTRYSMHCRSQAASQPSPQEEVVRRRFRERAQQGRPHPGDAADAIADSETSDDCLGEDTLGAKGFSLRTSPGTLTATLFPPGSSDGAGIRRTPFNLDTMGGNESSNPGRFLRDAVSGRFSWRIIPRRTSDMTEVTIEVTTANQMYRFSFDPQRGHIHTGTTVVDKQSDRRLYEFRLLEAAECSGGRWLPVHGVVKSMMDEPDWDGDVRVVQMKVTQFDADYRPQSDDFELELPPDTGVSVAGKLEWTRTSKDTTEQFGVDDLSALHERCMEQGQRYAERKKSRRTQAVRPGDRRSEFRRKIWFWSNLGLALFAAGIVLLLRRRRR